MTMELKLINDKGQAHRDASPRPTRCSAASTTRRWCTRSSPPTRPTRRLGTRAQKGRSDVNKSHQEAVAAERHRPRARRA